MPKYVIHTGPPKTGSKYLQSTLFYSRDALLASGINYANNWWIEPYQITHDPLLRLLWAKRYDEVKETFRQINSMDCRIVVLSCESFSGLNTEQFEVLRDAIGNNPVELIYYCRRWSERIPSDWKQAVQMGYFPTFPEFYMAYVRQAQFHGTINYSVIWAEIIRLFGRNSLKLVSYNNLRDRKIDLFQHFAETFLDWRGENQIPAGLIMNQASPNAIDTELIRALNRIDYQAIGRHRLNMRLKFTMMRGELDTRVVEELMSNDMGKVELSDGSEFFRLSWKEMNQYTDCLVRSTLFPRRIFEFRAISMPYVQSNYLLSEHAAGELHKLYRYLDKAPCIAYGLT
jgi:hypothetical protein